jgi:integrase
MSSMRPGYRSTDQSARGFAVPHLYLLALATGARQGELLALRWRDIDLSAGVVHIRGTLQWIEGEFRICEPKTEKGRRALGLPASVVSALQAHRIRQLEERLRAGDEWIETDHVFATATGAPLSRSTVSHRFKALVRQSGLPDQRFHDLRHCAASYLLALGESPRVAMEILGHSTISLTLNTYSHVVPELQRAATEKLGALLVTQG